jgi:hypothetical protein
MSMQHAPYPVSDPSTPEASFQLPDLTGAYPFHCQYSEPLGSQLSIAEEYSPYSSTLGDGKSFPLMHPVST